MPAIPSRLTSVDQGTNTATGQELSSLLPSSILPPSALTQICSWGSETHFSGKEGSTDTPLTDSIYDLVTGQTGEAADSSFHELTLDARTLSLAPSVTDTIAERTAKEDSQDTGQDLTMQEIIDDLRERLESHDPVACNQSRDEQVDSPCDLEHHIETLVRKVWNDNDEKLGEFTRARQMLKELGVAAMVSTLCQSDTAFSKGIQRDQRYSRADKRGTSSSAGEYDSHLTGVEKLAISLGSLCVGLVLLFVVCKWPRRGTLGAWFSWPFSLPPRGSVPRGSGTEGEPTMSSMAATASASAHHHLSKELENGVQTRHGAEPQQSIQSQGTEFAGKL